MMTRYLILLGLLTSCRTVSHVKNQAPLYTVGGQVLFTSSYCGGAYPNDEILEHHRTPRPAVDMTLYVRKGKTNNSGEPVIDSIRTDQNGRFTLKLPAGTYALILPEQLNRKILTRYTNDPDHEIQLSSPECLEKWWGQAWQILDIKKDTSGITYRFHKRCFLPAHIPCLEYNGPYPP